VNSAIVTAIGAGAAIASVTSFAPQAWKIIKTRETKDLSLPTYALTVTGFALWTTYGVLLAAWPLIVPNAICLVLAGFILVMKVLPRPTREAVADAVTSRTPSRDRGRARRARPSARRHRRR
jgi:MtN3 and saliva related transmembrane protein